MSWSNTRQSLIKGFVFYVRARTTNLMLGTQPSNPDIHKDFIASKAPDLALGMEENDEMRNGLQFGSKGELLKMNERVGDGIGPDDDAPELQMTIFPKAMFYVDGTGRIFDPKYDVYEETEDGHYEVLPFIWDYQIRGSFKESISMLSKAAGGKGDAKVSGTYDAAEITSYKKAVDGNWFVINRKIPLIVPETFVDDLGVTLNTYNDSGNLRTLQRPLRAETAKGPRTALTTSEIVPDGTEFFFGIRLLDVRCLKACLETLDYKESMGMLQWRGGGKGTLVWTLCNKEGIPYEDVPMDEITDIDKNIIAHCVAAVGPEIVDIPGLELPKIDSSVVSMPTKRKAKDKDADGEKKPAKRGRKPKEAAEPDGQIGIAEDTTTVTEGNADATPEAEAEPPKKKRTRRTKAEMEAARAAEAAKKSPED